MKNDYPALDAMSDLDLVILRHKVVNSKAPSDIAFKDAIDLKLKERMKLTK